MRNIQGVKIGNTVNFSIDGQLRKRVFTNSEDANTMFGAILKAKENPTDENLLEVELLYNKFGRIAYLNGFEMDDNGCYYLKGYNTPIPKTLLEVFEDYHENNYPNDAIVRFWENLMLNPDKRIRERLFDFIRVHDFSLTDNGYMVTYKAVYIKHNEVDNDLMSFVMEQYDKVKNRWKTNPSRYIVFVDDNTNEYGITKETTYNGWSNEKLENFVKLGNLSTMFDATEYHTPNVIYTDMFSETMNIEIGKPVYMDRTECDSDPSRDCSYGLHVGATRYVEGFAKRNSHILVCLVNPANVVAVPEYDHSKMRVSEYYPIGLAERVDRKIEIIEQSYFENDYSSIEEETFKTMIEKVKANELPIETAIKAEQEDRPMSELMKILEGRLVDIKTLFDN